MLKRVVFLTLSIQGASRNMFTGIIQGVSRIVSIEKELNLHKHTSEFPEFMLSDIEIGASVSYNGCCLTVVNINGNLVSFDLIKETLYTTNLSKLSPGDIVNIERAAKLNNEVGGHIMTGHIMTTAEIKKIFSFGREYQICLKLHNHSLMKYLFYKGFVGVDGASLTVGEIEKKCFYVHLIPETLRRTTLGVKKIGQYVNIEIDFQTQIIVDSIERILKSNNAFMSISSKNNQK